MNLLSFRHLRRCATTISTMTQKYKYMHNLVIKARSNIVWLDMEMTGLDVNNDRILEVACLITDRHLNVISKDFSVVIHQPDDVLDNMDSWCQKTFHTSGLTKESQQSQISTDQASEMLLNYIKEYAPEKLCPLAGNTIYMDKMFLMKYMPLVDDYLHYRIIDVSTIKELARRWHPSVYCRNKAFEHRALADVKESIAELRQYSFSMFNKNCNQFIKHPVNKERASATDDD